MAEDLKEAFPYFYKKQQQRQNANHLNAASIFDIKRNKFQITLEEKEGEIVGAQTGHAEHDKFSPRKKAIEMISKEISVIDQDQKKNEDKKKRKRIRFKKRVYE